MKPEIEKIAKQIKLLIDNAAEDIAGNYSIAEENYETLVDEVEREYESAKRFNAFLSENEGFTVNSIESEGYLRGLAYVMKLIKGNN